MLLVFVEDGRRGMKCVDTIARIRRERPAHVVASGAARDRGDVIVDQLAALVTEPSASASTIAWCSLAPPSAECGRAYIASTSEQRRITSLT
jgi:hypothetical protein